MTVIATNAIAIEPRTPRMTPPQSRPMKSSIAGRVKTKNEKSRWKTGSVAPKGTECIHSRMSCHSPESVVPPITPASAAIAKPLHSTIRRPRRSRLPADIDHPTALAPTRIATIANPIRNKTMCAISGVQKTLVWPTLW